MDSRAIETMQPATSLSRLVEPASVQGRGLSWWRLVGAIATVVVLVGLGLENMALRGHWHEVEDGVFWATRAEGITVRRVTLLESNEVTF
jgi:hypothetical protein